jgi:hypothetical protein
VAPESCRLIFYLPQLPKKYICALVFLLLISAKEIKSLLLYDGKVALKLGWGFFTSQKLWLVLNLHFKTSFPSLFIEILNNFGCWQNIPAFKLKN